jgi:hypothetical protein
MTPRQARRERRAAMRTANKRARKADQHLKPETPRAHDLDHASGANVSTEFCFSAELEDEFSPEFLAHAASVHERIARRIGMDRSTHTPAIAPAEDIAGAPEIRRTRTEINRLNAQRSTGPRTTPGKLASSRNSLKHGLASAQLIIPGENCSDFDALLSDLLAEHQPANKTEELLVHQIAQSWWLTRRSLRFQNECFTPDGVDEKRLSLFLRYQTTHERAFHKALNALMRLKKDRGRGFVSQTRLEAAPHVGFVPQNPAAEQASAQLARKIEPPKLQFKENAA